MLANCYAFNQLDLRKKLWDDILALSNSVVGPWCLAGDFNNVLSTTDRTGGHEVVVHEYQDLVHMMTSVGLFACSTTGDYYTWSNKHRQGMIYSRIDLVLGNMQWFLQYDRCRIEVLEPHIPDHSPLCIQLDIPSHYRRYMFKYLNCWIEDVDFMSTVAQAWQQVVPGRPQYAIWKKLQFLQPRLKQFNMQYSNIRKKIEHAREELEKIQRRLIADRFNPLLVDQESDSRQVLDYWLDLDEKVMAQRAKNLWLKLGDGNNSYFHALVKDKNRDVGILNWLIQLGEV